MAVSGDPVMPRNLAAVLVAGLILAVTIWLANRVAAVAQRGVEGVNRHPPADR